MYPERSRAVFVGRMGILASCQIEFVTWQHRLRQNCDEFKSPRHGTAVRTPPSTRRVGDGVSKIDDAPTRVSFPLEKYHNMLYHMSKTTTCMELPCALQVYMFAITYGHVVEFFV